MRHVLAAEGVGLERLTTVPDGRTGAVVREPVVAAAPAQVDYHRTASAGSTLGESDVVAATADIRGASWLHVTGVTPALSPSAADAVSHALRLATDAGVPASLDVNMRRKLWTTERAREVLSPLCRHVDVAFADSDELTVLTGLPVVAAVDDLHRRGVRLVVVKQGAEGAIVHEAAHEPLHLAGVRGFPVVDAIGAGDAFVAGFISALLTHAAEGQRGRGRLEYELACLTGAYAVSGHGDTTAFPERWRTSGAEGAVR